MVEGNADRVAYVLGHEISHHTLGHTRATAGGTEFLRITFSRDQEIAADRKGMELALRANYSYLGGLSAIRKMIDLGLNYSSFEGLAADHPSWFDRIGSTRQATGRFVAFDELLRQRSVLPAGAELPSG